MSEPRDARDEPAARDAAPPLVPGATGPVATSSVATGWAGVVIAVGVGAWLRAYGLGEQILIDDEFHAFRAGLRSDLSALYLFTTNTLPEDRLSDFAMPLALWVRALAATIGISEWTLRAPMWLAGVATIALVGALGRVGAGERHASAARTAVLAATLAAASPLLVLYSRFARPYAIVAMLGALALLAAVRFRAGGGRGNAVALAVAAALGVWFNAAAVPAFGVMVLLGLLPALRGRAGDAERRDALLGVGVGAAVAGLTIGPALPALTEFAERKAAAAPAAWSAWAEAALAAAGTDNGLVAAGFLAAALAGAAFGFRRAPAFVGFAVAALLAQLGAFVALRPYGGDEPLVIARYAIVALPGVLVLVALALDELASRVRPVWLASALAGAAIGGWIVAGPLLPSLGREDAYRSRPSNLVGAGNELDLAAVPAVYSELAAAERATPGQVVAELPWVLEWPLALAADYQQLHGARVVTATGFWTFREPAVRLASHLRWVGEPAELDASGVDLVIVHLDWVGEWQRMTGGALTVDPDRLAEARARYRKDARQLDRRFAQQPERFELRSEDEHVRVYAPRQVRSTGGEPDVLGVDQEPGVVAEHEREARRDADG